MGPQDWPCAPSPLICFTLIPEHSWLLYKGQASSNSLSVFGSESLPLEVKFSLCLCLGTGKQRWEAEDPSCQGKAGLVWMTTDYFCFSSTSENIPLGA